MQRISQFLVTVFTINLVLAATLVAQNCQCEQCGVQRDEGDNIKCVKVCKLKCIQKPVKFTCWKSEFEDVCVPCRSTKCEVDCVSGCSCKEGSDGCGRKRVYGVWQPNVELGAEVKTRRRLMRKTVTKMIPSFEWEIETRCHECCQNCTTVAQANHQIPAGAPQLPEGFTVIDLSEADKNQAVGSQAIDNKRAVAQNEVKAEPVKKRAIVQNEVKAEPVKKQAVKPMDSQKTAAKNKAAPTKNVAVKVEQESPVKPEQVKTQPKLNLPAFRIQPKQKKQKPVVIKNNENIHRQQDGAPPIIVGEYQGS